MKKEINSKSRRKWIMGGLAAFASVALLTTGFAVWVVGVTQTKADDKVKVDVDTARNDNVTFEVKLDSSNDKIALQEPKSTDDKAFVKIENSGSEEQKTDFEVTFSEFKITMPKNRYDQVKISFNTANDEEHIVDNSVATDGDKFKSDSKFQQTCENRKTYFDLVGNDNGVVTWDLTGDKFSSSELSGTTTYTLKNFDNVTMFQWGSFFGSTEPSKFYNETLLKDTNDQTTENAEKVKMELDSMHDKYVKTGTDATEVAISLHFELANSTGNTDNNK